MPTDFRLLPRDLRDTLETGLVKLFSPAIRLFSIVPDLIMFSAALSPSEKLLYGYYLSSAKRRNTNGEITATIRETCRIFSIEQSTLWRWHKNLHACGLMRHLESATGRLVLTLPEEFTVGHLLLLRPTSLPDPLPETRVLLLDAISRHPDREVFMPWLLAAFGAESTGRTTLRQPFKNV